MNKKAQAALEFLTTYGWAFLVILIVIGALAYFGVLNPSKFLPNRCNFGSEFGCEDYQISATADTFNLKLKNQAGEALTISSIALGSEGATTYVCTTAPTLADINPWKSGNITDLAWSTCNSAAAGFVSGEKGKVFVTISYYAASSSSAYTKQVSGEVLTAVI